jgi:hypothetical protein
MKNIKSQEKDKDTKKEKTCKYIFGELLQGHPGTILSMFISVRGTANLTSSGYAKSQRHRNHKKLQSLFIGS